MVGLRHIGKFVFCLFALFASSCREEEGGVSSSIPYAPVALQLELNSPLGRPLAAPGGIVLITEPIKAYTSLGNRGLAIVRPLDALGQEYYAYDLICPYEVYRKDRLELNGINLGCLRCGSQFEVISGIGHPVHGPARERLRQYQIKREGYVLWVRN